MADEDVDDGWRSGPAAPTKDAAFSSDTDDDDCDGDGDGDDEHGSDRDTLAVPASEKDPDVVALYKARAREPEKYSAHEALVAALRQQPDRAGQLRAAREEFARSFALPPLLWRQWIRDEAKDLDPDSDSSTREVVRQLCELLEPRQVAERRRKQARGRARWASRGCGTRFAPSSAPTSRVRTRRWASGAASQRRRRARCAWSR